jgi:alkylation response protein AidB-like acyl-CoA dehydrogenase
MCGMNFAFTEEQEGLRNTVHMETDKGYDDAVWSQMGLQGLAIPEEFGGSGYSFVELGIVLEEIGIRKSL